MRHYLEKSYQDLFTGSARISIAASGVVSIISPVDGDIIEIRIYVTSPSGGISIWNVRANGVATWTGGARPSIVAPAISVVKTGLSTAVLKDQIIRLDLEDPGASGALLPITMIVIIEDGTFGPGSEKIWLPAAGANGTTPSSFWDLPAATAPTPTNVAGSNVHKAVLSFADAGNSFAETTILLPADWYGTIDARILWYTPATSGNCKWFVATSFTSAGAAAADDAAYNTAQTVVTAAPGTANRIQTSNITGLTLTGAVAGGLMHIKISRDGTDSSDTIAAAALLVGVELTIRRT